MPQRVYCPDCDTPRVIPDGRRVGRVKCRTCDRVFRVGERNEARPPDRRPVEHGNGHRTFTLIAVGGILLATGLVCGGGLAGWYFLTHRPAPADRDDPDIDFIDDPEPPPAANGPRPPPNPPAGGFPPEG